jgi:signal transduction histidine kinase/HPt (histidine-containing phosphotransfer) domain-containing protein
MTRFDIAVSPDGEAAPIVEASWLPLPGGRRLLLQRDVTEDRQRRRDLLESNLQSARDAAQLRAMHDALSDGIALVGSNGDIIAANRTLREQGGPAWARAGYRHHIADVLWNEVLAGAALKPQSELARELADRRERFEAADGSAELRRLPDGRWVEVSWLTLADGRRLLVHRDVSERVRRDAALERVRLEAERTRELMQTVLETMQDGVLLVDGNEICRYANTAALAMHDVPSALVEDKPTFGELVRWLASRGEYGPPEQAAATVAEVMRRFGAAPGYSHTRQRRNGRWIEYSYFRVHEGGTLAVFRDVTALKVQEAQLARERDAAQAARGEAEAANLAKSTFLATMSHEIRTPMNGVIGMMDVLESQTLGRAQRQIVATMRESAITLLRIVSDVLDFSKIEAGRLELEDAPFSLAALVAGAAGTLRPRATAQGLTLEEHVEGEPDLLMGDATRLRQILFNLLGNAIKFTEHGGVSVTGHSIRQPDGRARVEFAVRDTGVGIEPHVLPRLFTEFTQGDNSTTRRFGGTGLGLSIVRRLAQLMDGGVQVESRPGEGACFRVTLHLRIAAETDPVPPSAPALAAPVAPGTGRVLVVDDHPVNREVLLRQLGMLGVAADAAADGDEALVRWRAGGYAVVLSDLHMPGLDGFEFVRLLRAEEAAARLPRTPIVAVTANALAGEPERCAEADMDGFLAKPVTIRRLRGALERWLTLAAPNEAVTVDSGLAPAIDPTALEAWFGSDRPAIREMLGRFLASAQVAEVELAEAVAARSSDVPAAAHRLRGAALTVGARGIGSAAAELERSAQSGEFAACSACLATLGSEIRRLAAELAAGD